MTATDPTLASEEDGVRWLATIVRRACLLLAKLVEERYPDLKRPACPHCGRALPR